MDALKRRYLFVATAGSTPRGGCNHSGRFARGTPASQRRPVPPLGVLIVQPADHLVRYAALMPTMTL